MELSLKEILGLFNPFRLVGKDGLTELTQQVRVGRRGDYIPVPEVRGR